MNAKWKRHVPVTLLAALVVIVLILVASAQAQRRGGGTTVVGSPASISGPRYTVIETQGFNLLVADNATNKLYYYATDKDVPVGAPLKLRASLDLTKVGQEQINITPHNLENMRKKKTEGDR